MRTFINAKAVANTVRAEFTARGVQLSHSESLEVTARAFGAADWNTLSAKIKQVETLNRSANGDRIEPLWPEVAQPFYEKHLSQEERSGPWPALFQEVRSLYAGGAKATSGEALDLARRWVNLSKVMSGGNPDIIAKSAAAYREALSDPQVSPKLPLSRDLLTWFGPALTTALRGQKQA